MEFDAVLHAGRAVRRPWPRATGPTAPSIDELDACVAACPDKLALTAVQARKRHQVTRFTYRELAAMADRVAVGLAKLGVGQQRRGGLPVAQLVAVHRGLPGLFAHRCGDEPADAHLPRARAVLHAPARRGQGADRAQGVPGFRPRTDGHGAASPACRDLQHIVVVNGTGANSYEALLSESGLGERARRAREILTRHRPGPDDVTQLIYTSGTTGEPKGVMHTANTVMANIVPYAQRLQLDAEDVVLMASPMAHQTGFMYGLIMPILLKASAVIYDTWEPLKAIELIRAEGCSFTMASTPVPDRPGQERGRVGQGRAHAQDLPVRRRAHPRSAGRAGARRCSAPRSCRPGA